MDGPTDGPMDGCVPVFKSWIKKELSMDDVYQANLGTSLVFLICP